MGSPLDSVINVWRADNKQHLIGNDDQGGVVTNDSAVEFTAPVDGDYYLRVRDHRGRGGDEFVYRVEITEKPSPSAVDLHPPLRPEPPAEPPGDRRAQGQPDRGAGACRARQQVGGDLDAD